MSDDGSYGNFGQSAEPLFAQNDPDPTCEFLDVRPQNIYAYAVGDSALRQLMLDMEKAANVVPYAILPRLAFNSTEIDGTQLGRAKMMVGHSHDMDASPYGEKVLDVCEKWSDQMRTQLMIRIEEEYSRENGSASIADVGGMSKELKALQFAKETKISHGESEIKTRVTQYHNGSLKIWHAFCKHVDDLARVHDPPPVRMTAEMLYAVLAQLGNVYDGFAVKHELPQTPILQHALRQLGMLTIRNRPSILAKILLFIVAFVLGALFFAWIAPFGARHLFSGNGITLPYIEDANGRRIENVVSDGYMHFIGGVDDAFVATFTRNEPAVQVTEKDLLSGFVPARIAVPGGLTANVSLNGVRDAMMQQARPGRCVLARHFGLPVSAVTLHIDGRDVVVFSPRITQRSAENFNSKISDVFYPDGYQLKVPRELSISYVPAHAPIGGRGGLVEQTHEAVISGINAVCVIYNDIAFGPREKLPAE